MKILNKKYSDVVDYLNTLGYNKISNVDNANSDSIVTEVRYENGVVYIYSKEPSKPTINPNSNNENKDKEKQKNK